jgi:hypothetical protein
MNKWLQNYPIHTYLSPWIFVLAGAGMLFITLCTVSFQALKAALLNPVKVSAPNDFYFGFVRLTLDLYFLCVGSSSGFTL